MVALEHFVLVISLNAINILTVCLLNRLINKTSHSVPTSCLQVYFPKYWRRSNSIVITRLHSRIENEFFALV